MLHLSDNSIAVILLCRSVDTKVLLAGTSFPTCIALMHRSRIPTSVGSIWWSIASLESGYRCAYCSMASVEYGLLVVPMLDMVMWFGVGLCCREDVDPSCTLSGFHGKRLVISMCGHVASSSLVGILDVNESFVPRKVRGIVGPPST